MDLHLLVDNLTNPALLFFFLGLLKKRVGVQNAAAIAAAYGSVSAVTFVTTVAYLDMEQIAYSGYMVAVMAIMEAPSIIIGVLLMMLFTANRDKTVSMGSIIKHSVTNGSVLLIIGSLVIGFMASDAQAQGIAPFTTDIFKGFLAVFLLDMGISSGKKIGSLKEYGAFPYVFAIAVPIVNGIIVSLLSGFITESVGNRLLFAILAASASYIAVPAAMKLAAPKANEGLYLPMALAITFPFNITLGMPLYLCIINWS